MQNPENPDTAAVGAKKNARSTLPDDHDHVEVTLDIIDEERAALHIVTATAEGSEKTPPSSVTSSAARKSWSRVRYVSQELKRLASLGHRHQPERRLDRSKSAAACAIVGLKFISGNDGAAAWAEVEGRFNKLTAKTDGRLHRSAFGKCVGMNEESDKFAGELFDALSRRRKMAQDSITKAEMREFWSQISDQSFDARLQTFFDMVDKDADGRITEDEVKEIIVVSASANKLSNIGNEEAEEYARLIMEELDQDNRGFIMIENLETLLIQGPTHAAQVGHGRQLSNLLSLKRRISRKRCHYMLADNWKRVWVMGLWVGIMAALFAWKYVQYRNKPDVFAVMGHCVCMAKGAAETLKLNMALVLLPVCRNTITWLRNKTSLGIAVPFDDNLNFHQVIAGAIAVGVGIHGISHLACDFPRLLRASPEKYKPMEGYFGHQPTSYWHFVKQWEGVTGISMVVLMAISFTLASPLFRRNKLVLKLGRERKNLSGFKAFWHSALKKLTGFNAFWYSHHLFVVVYALLIVHGIKLYLTHQWYKKTTWMYLAIPVALYAGERLVRTFRSRVKEVQILNAKVYGDVLTLQMSKPQGFDCRSGQYIFVKCAKVSPFEWHPFSLTSAPMDEYVSVHIRSAGDWTRRIVSIFKNDTASENNPNWPKVSIDGPYGAPTQEYKDYEVVLLVGLGIGATPVISVVKDILNNMKRKNVSGFKTRKAYFYWVTKEQGSFDWFKGVMNEAAEMGAVEMHNHCTSVYEESDARSTLIAMLQSINHAKKGVDIVSGTKVKSHFGRPKWKDVFRGIAVAHPDATVGVFYCGVQQAVKELRDLASEFSRTTSTKFEFHKENF